VVFDVDDTLYLERDYVRSGFRAVDTWVSRELGASGFGVRAWQTFLDGVRGTIFNEVLEDMGFDDEPSLIRDMVEVYRTHEPDISLLADARACLETLEGPFDLAALTGGPMASQRRKVAALGIESRFSPLVYASKWGAEFDKPHPRSFRHIEALTDLHGREIVYVADNPEKDFDVPLELGWRTIRVRRPKSLHVDMETPSGVDAELTGLAPLCD
jgi:putative hydrolase of the HAD superfamily